MHKFEIKQRPKSKGLMKGANTVIYMDGKPLRGCYHASFVVDAKGIAKLTLGLYGNFSVKGKSKPEIWKKHT